MDQPADSSVSFGAAGGRGEDNWWEQVDLIKLILAGNQLTELSEEIQHLPALNVLDVSVCVRVCVGVSVCGVCVGVCGVCVCISLH